MTIKMLVVSSVELLAKSIVRQLEHLDLEILTAWHIDDALEMLESQKIDLLLTDNILRYGSGPELIEKVRKKYPQIKIIIMSSFLGRDEIPSGVGFISKPWGMNGYNDLVEQVEVIIKGAQK